MERYYEPPAGAGAGGGSTQFVFDDWSALSCVTLRFHDALLEAEFAAEWDERQYCTWDAVGPLFSLLVLVFGLLRALWMREAFAAADGLALRIAKMLLPLMVRGAPLVARLLLPRTTYLRHRTAVMASTRVGRALPYLLYWPLSEQSCRVVASVAKESCMLGLLAQPAWYMVRFRDHLLLKAVTVAQAVMLLLARPGGVCEAAAMLAGAAPGSASGDAAATAAATSCSISNNSLLLQQPGYCSAAFVGGKSCPAAAAMTSAASVGMLRCPHLGRTIRRILDALLVLLGLTFEHEVPMMPLSAQPLATPLPPAHQHQPLQPAAANVTSAAMSLALAPGVQAQGNACSAAAAAEAALAAAAAGDALDAGGSVNVCGATFDACLAVFGTSMLAGSIVIALVLYRIELQARHSFLKLRGMSQLPSIEMYLTRVNYLLGPLLLGIITVSRLLLLLLPRALLLLHEK